MSPSTPPEKTSIDPTPDPIGWYVHVPFCHTKCGYCDFYSVPTISTLVDPLVSAIQREIEARDPTRPVESVFVGGGTPTVLPAAALKSLLATIGRRTLDTHPSRGTAGAVEFTVEANPATVDELKLDLLREAGGNRLSFGAQSFDPRDLAVLQRIHDPVHIAASVKAARAAGFDNLNLDLIYAIPGQTRSRWADNLHRAVDLGPEHLSCYGLTYEPGTQLTLLRNRRLLAPTDEEQEAEFFEFTIDELARCGFVQYEISNFARPGRQCRANRIYWENRDYLGIGPSAVSYLGGTRRKNVADVRRYIDGARAGCSTLVAEQESLPPAERAAETAIQMLRLTEGIDGARFSRLTGFDAHALFDEAWRQFDGLGLIERSSAGIRLTRRGMLVANRVMAELIPDHDDPTPGNAAPREPTPVTLSVAGRPI